MEPPKTDMFFPLPDTTGWSKGTTCSWKAELKRLVEGDVGSKFYPMKSRDPFIENINQSSSLLSENSQ